MNTPGLVALARGMQAYLAGLPGNHTRVLFGWRAREEVINQGWDPSKPSSGANRIVVIPGDPDSGDGGKLERGRKVDSGQNARTLLNWRKRTTLCLWGVNASNETVLRDEGEQAAATEALVELAIQAVHHARDPVTGEPVGLANIEWEGTKWNTRARNIVFGRELFLYMVQKSPLWDQPQGKVYPKLALTKSLQIDPTADTMQVLPVATSNVSLGVARYQLQPVNTSAGPVSVTAPPYGGGAGASARLGDIWRVVDGAGYFATHACTVLAGANMPPIEDPRTGLLVASLALAMPNAAWKLETDSRLGPRWVWID